MKKLNNPTENFVSRRINQRRVRRWVALLSALVLFLTVNTLKLEADTLERIATCGIEQHVHDESCYDASGALICGLAEHAHTDACFQQRPQRHDLTRVDGFMPLNAKVTLATPMPKLTSNSADGQDAVQAEADYYSDIPTEVGSGIEPPVDEIETELAGEDAASAVEDAVPLEIVYENQAEETVQQPEYVINGSAVLLSDILSALGMKVSGIQSAGELEGDTFAEDPVNFAVEATQNDYELRVLRDFDAAELGVVTADEVIVITLKNGIAPVEDSDDENPSENDDINIEETHTEETDEEAAADETVDEEAEDSADELTENADDEETGEASDEATVDETEEEAVETVEETETAAVVPEKQIALDFADYDCLADATVYFYAPDRAAVLVNAEELAEADGVHLTVNAPVVLSMEADLGLAELEAALEEAPEDIDARIGENPVLFENGVLIISGDGELTVNGVTYTVTNLTLPARSVESDNITISTVDDQATLLGVTPAFEDNGEDEGDIYALFAASMDENIVTATSEEIQIDAIEPAKGLLRSSAMMATTDAAPEAEEAVADAEETAGTETTEAAVETRTLRVRVYDVSLIREGESVEPDAPIHVETTFDAPLEGENFQLYHIVDGKPEEVDGFVKTDDQGRAIGMSFDTASLSPFAVVYYTVEYTTDNNEVTVKVDFTDIVQNGADFDANSVITALNDGVSVSISELEKGYIEGTEGVVHGELYIDYTTADNKNENIKNVNWIGLKTISAEDGLTVADGMIRVTKDGTVVLSDGVSTIIIVISGYQNTVQKVLGDGATIQALEGQLPMGASAEYKDLSDKADELAQTYNLKQETENANIGFSAFDVSVSTPDGEQDVEGQFAVTVDHNIQIPEGAKVELFHIHNGEAELVENAQVEAGKVTFVTDGFSEYVIRYTVDFEYNGQTFSIQGLDDILLSKLLAELKMSVDIQDVKDVVFSNPELVEVEELRGDWNLISKKAFGSDETLTLTLKNGEEIVITVKDAQYTGDLNSLLTKIAVTVDGNPVKDGDSVQIDKNSTAQLKLTLEENDYFQFYDDATEMVYHLPDGLNFGAAATTYITVDMGIDGKVYRNPLTYDPETNTITLKWNTKDPNFPKLISTDNAKIDITLNATFKENVTHVDFGCSLSIDVNPKEYHDANVTKSHEFFAKGAPGNPYDCPAVKYTVVVTSNGTTTIDLQDVVQGTAINLDTDSSKISVVSNKGTTITPTFTEKGFTLNNQNLQDGEQVTITYWGKVDTSKIDNLANATVTETGNTVTLTGDEEPNGNTSTDYVHQIQANDLTKSSTGVEQPDENGKQIVHWQIVVNEAMIDNLSGSTITDSIAHDSRWLMDYNETGIHVVATNASGRKVIDGDYTWSTGNPALDADNEKWVFTVPEASEPLKYVITYDTIVDTEVYYANNPTAGYFSVVNNSEGKPGTGSGSATVGHPAGEQPPQEINYTKKAVDVNEETITWNVSINIDQKAGGYSEYVITETMPQNTFGDIGYIDELESIEVLGLNEGEWYSITPVYGYKDANGNPTSNAYGATGDYLKPSSYTLTFYKDGCVGGDVKNTNGQNSTANPGLNADSSRTMTVRVVTRNSEGWLALAAEEGIAKQTYLQHTNTVKVNNLSAVSDTASPMAKTVYKMRNGVIAVTGPDGTANVYKKVDVTAEPDVIVNSEKTNYTAYKFWVLVGGVTKDNLKDTPAGKQLVIEDEFDPLFRLILDGEDSKEPKLGGAISPTSFNAISVDPSKGESFSWSQSAGKAVFTITNPPKNGDNYYPYYQVEYWLVPTSEEALQTIKQLTLEAGGDKIFKNRASTDGGETELGFKYTYNVVDKSVQQETTSAGITLEKYKIEINKDKLTLNGGNTMTLTDTYTSNLSVDFSKAEVTAINRAGEDISDQVTWDYSGNVGTFRIPDEAYVVITYSGRVVGEAGSLQVVSNTAYMEGYYDTVTNERIVDLEGSARADRVRVRLMKYAADKMGLGLNGAKFRLLDQDKNPVLDKDGNQIIYTTGTGYLNKLGVLHAAGDALDYTFDEGTGNYNVEGVYKALLNAEGQARWDAGTIENPTSNPDKIVTYGDLSSASYSALGISLRSGFAEIALNQSEQGIALKRERVYYLEEIETPVDNNGQHYEKDFVKYSFLITDQANYTAPGGVYVYHNNDIVTVRNWPADEATLKIAKTFTGNAELTDAQKNQITFTVQKKVDGNWEDYPIDVWNTTSNQREAKATFTYGDYAANKTEDENVYVKGDLLFKNGVLTIDKIQAGEYRVIESNAALEDELQQAYTRKTEYLVDGEKQTVTDETQGVSVTISEDDVINNVSHDFSITNSYFTHKYEITKVSAETAQVLGNAKFAVHKATDNSIVKENLTTGSNGKLSITKADGGYDYDTLYYIVETQAPDGYITPEVSEREKLYFYFSNPETSPAWKPGAELPNGESAVDLTTGYGSATIPNRRDSSRKSVTVNKKWVDKSGKDVTPTMQSSDAVTLKLYRTTDKLTVGQVVDGGDVANAKSTSAIKTLSNGNQKLYFAEGDRIQITVAAADNAKISFGTLNNNPYIAFKDIIGNNNTEVKNRSVSFAAPNQDAQLTIAVTPSDTAIAVKMVNLDDADRVYKLTHTEAVSITKAETEPGTPWSMDLPLNPANGWSQTVDALPVSDASGNLYTYFVVEDNGGNTNASYDVGGNAVTVTNTAPDKLEVVKRWYNANNEQITDKKDGQIVFELHQVENELAVGPYTGTGSFGVNTEELKRKNWGTVGVTPTGNLSGIKKDSKVEIKITTNCESNASLTGAINITGANTVSDSIDVVTEHVVVNEWYSYDRFVSRSRTILLDAVSDNIGISGEFQSNDDNTTIVVTVLEEPTNASQAFEDKQKNDLGTVAVTYDTAEMTLNPTFAPAYSNVYAVPGTKAWSALIANLPTSGTGVAGGASAGKNVTYTYYVVETQVSGFEEPKYEYSEDEEDKDAAPGETVVIKNTEEAPKDGSLSIIKAVSNASELAAGKNFTFNVALTNATTAIDASKIEVTGGTKGTAVTSGNTVTIPVTVTGTGTVVLNKIPVGTTYVVTEPARDPADGWVQDGAVVYSADPQAIVANTTQNATVKNKYVASGKTTFDGVKEIVNRNFKDGDTLTVSITGDGKLPSPANKEVVLTAGQSTADFSFAQVEYTWDDIKDSTATPKSKTFHYTVTETANMAGTTPDSKSHTIEVTVTDNGNGTLQVTKAYKAGSEQETKTRFVNIYSTTASVNIPGTKELTGKTPGNGDFFFNIAAVTTGAPMPTTTKVSNTGTDFSFGPIEYDLNAYNAVADHKYVYRITEDQDGVNATTHVKDNNLYDQTQIEVTVTLSYNETTGVLSATVDKNAEAVKFTNIPQTTTVTADKRWLDVNDQDASDTLPTGAKAKFGVYRDGAVTPMVQFEMDGAVDTEPTGDDPAAYEDAAWHVTFKNLPKYKGDGSAESVYVVKEIEVTGVYGFANQNTDGVANGGTITNKQEDTEVPVSKKWLKNDGTTAAWPTDSTLASITVQLKAGDQVVATYQLTSEHPNYTFDKLPKVDMTTGQTIAYTVEEVSVEGYISNITGDAENGFVITNTPDKTNVTVTKNWADSGTVTHDNDWVKVKLYRNDVDIGEAEVQLDKNTTPTPWSKTWDNLPAVDDGTGAKYVYTVIETDYHAENGLIYTSDSSVGSAKAMTADGKNWTVTINNTAGDTVDVEATKTWTGGQWPKNVSVVFTLKQNGNEYRTPVTVTANNAPDYKASWEKLPKNDQSGQPYVYTVEETVMIGTKTLTADDFTAGTMTKVTGEDYKWTVNNDMTTVDVPVHKTWANNTPYATAVRFELQTSTGTTVTEDAYGNKITNPVVLNAANSWTDNTSFVKLPKLDANGDAITYQMVETGVLFGEDDPAVETNWKSPDEYFEVGTPAAYETTGFQINNTPEKTTVTVNKKWFNGATEITEDIQNATASVVLKVGENNVTADADGQAFAVTAPVTIENGVVTLTDDAWTYTWNNLNKYDANGQEIQYMVTETGATVSGDDLAPAAATGTLTDGYLVNNTLPTFDIPVLKTWSGVVPQDGDYVKFTLYQGDNIVKESGTENDYVLTVAYDETNNKWPTDAVNFAGLPKYDNSGAPITYKVVETEVKLGGSTLTNPALIKTVYGNQTEQTIESDKTIATVEIVNTVESTKYKIKKDWVNGELHGVLPPDDAVVQVKLEATVNVVPPEKPNESAVPTPTTIPGIDETITLNGGKSGGNDTADKKWEYEWSNLPKYSDTGLEIFYNASEISYKIGETEYVDKLKQADQWTEYNSIVFTNKTPDTEFEVTKAWVNGKNNTPPEGASITVTLYKGATAADATTEVSSIVLNGTADGTVSEGVLTRTIGETTGTADAYEDSAWHAKWSNLPMYDTDGHAIVYVAKETEYTGYTASYPSITTTDAGTTTTTAKDYALSGETITNTEDEITLSGTKTWVDEKAFNAASTSTLRPENLTIKLYTVTGTAPNETENEVTLQTDTTTANYYLSWDKTTNTNVWTYTITHLPKKDAEGHDIVYRVKETVPDGYRADNGGVANVQDDATTTDAIEMEGLINTEVTSISATKVWKLNDQEITEPEGITSITLHLNRTNGEAGFVSSETNNPFYTTTQKEATGTTYTPFTITRQGDSAPYTWPTLTVENLPKYWMDGSEVKTYTYFFVEDTTNLTGWSVTYSKEGVEPTSSGSSVTTNGGETITITNSKWNVSLPSTGGPGTTGFYIVGSILTLLAAVLLITKKRSDGAGIE